MGDAEVGVEIQIESSLLKAGPAEVYLALEQDLAKFVANAFDLLCHRGGTAWCVSLIGDAESAPDVDGWVRHLCQFFRDRKAPEDIRMAVEVKREWWVDVYPEQNHQLHLTGRAVKATQGVMAVKARPAGELRRSAVESG